MNWGSWNEFWAMGGYAFYVWGSYGVTAVVLLIEIAALTMRKKAAFENLRQTAQVRSASES